MKNTLSKEVENETMGSDSRAPNQAKQNISMLELHNLARFCSKPSTLQNIIKNSLSSVSA